MKKNIFIVILLYSFCSCGVLKGQQECKQNDTIKIVQEILPDGACYEYITYGDSLFVMKVSNSNIEKILSVRINKNSVCKIENLKSDIFNLNEIYQKQVIDGFQIKLIISNNGLIHKKITLDNANNPVLDCLFEIINSYLSDKKIPLLIIDEKD